MLRYTGQGGWNEKRVFAKKKIVLFVKETSFGEKNGKKFGTTLNIVPRDVGVLGAKIQILSRLRLSRLRSI